MITLIKPNKSLEQDIYQYKEEMITHGDPSLNGCGGLHRFDTYDEWIHHINQYLDRTTIPQNSNYVEGSQWLLVDTSLHRVLGMINIRHYLNDFLLEFGGHIGYSIRPSERRKGYAKQQLMFALDILRQKGEPKALLTCDTDNIASAKTIEACGGVLENIVHSDEHGDTKRYWIDLTNNL